MTCPHKTLCALTLLLVLSGCGYERHVQTFNQRHYDACVKKHGGETWVDKRTGLPLGCKPATYPSCEQTLSGLWCHQ